MAKDYIGYEALADNALRSVVKEALARAAKQGLIGNHHFYITFKTHDPGVEIPEFLKQRYPDEMTIVLQNQFWGLKVGDDGFEVGLTFQKMPATLVVPFAAMTSFVDPGVQFGLQFRNSSAAKAAEAKGEEAKPSTPAAVLPGTTPPSPPPKPLGEKPAGSSHPRPEEEPVEKPASEPQIVSLDKFRKK